MTNKEIYALCKQAARALKQQNLTSHISRAQQALYDILSPILSTTINTQTKESVETLSQLTSSELRARLKAHLIKRLEDGTLLAAEIGQLKDVFALDNEVVDLQVELVDYRNACEDCPLERPPLLPEAPEGAPKAVVETQSQ